MEIGSVGEDSVIKIKLGFLLAAVGGLISLILVFGAMRQDVLQAIGRIEKLETIRQLDLARMDSLTDKVNKIDSNLFYFREEYNTDSNKYIREPKDRK